MKRLLGILLSLIFIVSALASCGKVEEVGDASGSESYLESDASGESAKKDGDNTDNKNNSNNKEENVEEEEDDDGKGNTSQEKPAFNGKESTSGLKFELNADKQSYTLVGKGTCKATDIVIDGHDGLPVTVIGYNAFGDDQTITSVKIGDYVEYIEEYAFSMCKKMTSLTLGKRVKFLGDYCFRYCQALTSVEIKENVETIKYGAFYNCKALSNIKIPDSVRIIEEYAFDKTAYATDTSKWTNNVLYIGNHLIQAKTSISGTCKIKDGTKSIAAYAFSGCTSLSGVTIPDSVKAIGAMAFNKATALNTISIGSGVEYIGELAFENTKFYNASGNWKSNVLYIGKYLISAKPALSGKCTITDGPLAIAELAFYDCEKLAEVVIPNSVVAIGDYAFLGCKKLEKVTIGSGVKTIGVYAFKNCSALKEITMKKTSGWTAGDISIDKTKLASKEEAVTYLVSTYPDRVWKR